MEATNEGIAETLKSLTEKEKGILIEIDSLKDSVADLAVLKKESLDLDKQGLEHTKSIEFYKKIDVCPTFTQEISHNHRTHMVSCEADSLIMVNSSIADIAEKLKKAKDTVDILRGLQSEVRDIQASISSYQNMMYANIQLIKKANHQIEEMSTDTRSIDAEKEKLKAFAKAFLDGDKRRKILLEKQQYLDFNQQILADGGIKSKIIKQYIPTINKLINKYLAALDFFVSFHLDENFDETIKSRHRDSFTYNNFSDGQAARIDLALMLAWRDVSKMRNAVNVNLAIFDESDASMDMDGSSLLTDLFATLDKTNVFVISHKEAMKNKVDNVLTLDVKNNFTVLVECLD